MLNQAPVQVGYLGEGYEAWLQRPVPGPSVFFHSPWLEHLTKTPWCEQGILFLALVTGSWLPAALPLQDKCLQVAGAAAVGTCGLLPGCLLPAR